jgi:hypothetical protein
MAMPKYFFHLDRTGGELADTTGAELVDDQHRFMTARSVILLLGNSGTG